MSNTCDIATDNKRLENSFVQFSCIFRLNDYLDELKSRGIKKQRIDDFISNLKDNNPSIIY